MQSWFSLIRDAIAGDNSSTPWNSVDNSKAGI